MLRLFPVTVASCEGRSRREILEIGTVSLLGLSWPQLLQARPTRPPTRARSCVVIFLFGGPGQQDLWDLKPQAPAEVRGEYRPIATNVTGVQIGEKLPHLARQADKFTLVRSVAHTDFEHGSASYTALTGHPHPQPGTNTPARPEDFPTYASVVSKLRPARRPVPEAVVLGPVMHQGNRPPLAGQNAGFLGRVQDAFRIAEDPSAADFHVEGLAPSEDMTADRQGSRQGLLKALDAHARQIDTAAGEMSGLYQQAFQLLLSAQTRRAFDLAGEKPALRDRYGRSRFGQTLLLARRLIESGVPFVTVNWARQNGDQWDTHKANYAKLPELLPPFDQGLAAFLEDLQTRGLLDSTLVYCLGEFGRTPQINKDGGRDHWPACYSVLLAGGGIGGGRVFGASDRMAAYPTAQPVAPWDLAATLYHGLGLDPTSHLHDPLGRPIVIAPGSVVPGLLASS